jgi:hypothetical protein
MPAVSIHYSIPSYLFKFLSAKIGHPYKVRLNEHNISRSIVRSLSGKTILDHRTNPDPDSKYKHQQFTVIIPPKLNEAHWVWNITPQSEFEFICEVDAWFNSLLFQQIIAFKVAEKIVLDKIKSKAGSAFPLSTKAAIVEFLDSCNITEEDIKVETLIKRHQRNRDK